MVGLRGLEHSLFSSHLCKDAERLRCGARPLSGISNNLLNQAFRIARQVLKMFDLLVL